MTLIELLVAMTLGLLIALAAAAALLVSRQGFTAVDASSQLRDNGRFLQSIIQRLGVQAGYKDLGFATDTAAQSNSPAGVGPEGITPYVFGLNNASRTSTNTWDEGTARTSSQLGYGSDILVLRYQTSTTNPGATESDGTIIDCAGIAPTAAPGGADDTVVSILHVGVGSDGEPSLMCSRSATGDAPYDTQPLVQGVENFQVLYGVDGVAPGNTVVPIAAAPDSIPERYLRANQLTVVGNDIATYANWRRVRSIRIGVVLRGGPGSAVDRTSQTFYPLGVSKDSTSGTPGSAFANNTNDPGTIFTPAADGRLRQAMTFTVHLRNSQGE
ncbi:MAG: PilW family protein [Comamonadaceae bacterium]|nr:PilW family protein [Comamonadaceae bacterium]MBH2043365.1 PilW family protein [Comamonadaceae bacterium]